MDFVSTLINSGLDAFSNLYDIRFVFPSDLLTRIASKTEGLSPEKIKDMLIVRVGDFNAPQPRLAQYMTDYKTIQITRAAPMMEFERKFDLNFRVDANYIVYHVLKGWSFLYHDLLQGGINLPGNESELFGTIYVNAYAPNTMDVVANWTFGKVICNKVTEPNFTRAGTEPIVVTASFMFLEYLPNQGTPEMIAGTLVT